jgi:hypothetical protein
VTMWWVFVRVCMCVSVDKEINVLVIVSDRPDKPVEIQAFDSLTPLDVLENQIRARTALTGGNLIHFDSLRAVKDGPVPGGNYRFVGGTAAAPAAVAAAPAADVVPAAATSCSSSSSTNNGSTENASFTSSSGSDLNYRRKASISNGSSEFPLVSVKMEVTDDASTTTKRSTTTLGSNSGPRGPPPPASSSLSSLSASSSSSASSLGTAAIPTAPGLSGHQPYVHSNSNSNTNPHRYSNSSSGSSWQSSPPPLSGTNHRQGGGSGSNNSNYQRNNQPHYAPHAAHPNSR